MHQTHLRGGQQQRKRSPVGGLIAAAGRMLVGNQPGGQVPGSSTYAMAGAPGEEEDTPRDDDEGVEIKRTVSTADDHVEGYASGGASNDVVRVVRYCRIPPPFSQNEQHPILLTHVTTLPLSPGAC